MSKPQQTTSRPFAVADNEPELVGGKTEQAIHLMGFPIIHRSEKEIVILDQKGQRRFPLRRSRIEATGSVWVPGLKRDILSPVAARKWYPWIYTGHCYVYPLTEDGSLQASWSVGSHWTITEDGEIMDASRLEDKGFKADLIRALCGLSHAVVDDWIREGHQPILPAGDYDHPVRCKLGSAHGETKL